MFLIKTFYFVLWSAEKSDIVQNCRFLDNFFTDFDENQGVNWIFDTLSAENIIYYKARESKIEKKVDFSQFYTISAREIGKNGQIFNPDSGVLR